MNRPLTEKEFKDIKECENISLTVVYTANALYNIYNARDEFTGRMFETHEEYITRCKERVLKRLTDLIEGLINL